MTTESVESALTASADAETTTVEAPATFARTLTWRGGFWLAFAAPVGGLTLVGYEIGALGAYGALAVWLGTSVIALLQNYIYAELAGMYPRKSGGIGLYASDIWSKYFAPIGGVFGWGYWAGWSLTLAVGSLVVGDLVQAQYFPHTTGTISLLGNDVGLATFIAAGLIIVLYLVGISGIRFVVNTNMVLGASLIIFAAVCIVGPFLIGEIHTGSLTFDAGVGPWNIAMNLLTWAFVASWTAYGTEIAATFTPEYRSPKTDVVRALRSSALFMIVLVGLTSTVFPAAIGQQAVASDPVGFFAPLMSKIVGHAAGDVAIAFVCIAAVIALLSATADSGRALYGMAVDGITLRQFGKLNRAGQPARAMTVDLVFNLLVLFFVSNVAGIIFASNFGYLVAVVFALAGFVVLRRTHPDAERPFRLRRMWVPIACVLVVINVAIICTGFTHTDRIGYGGGHARLIGLGVVALGFLSYFFARGAQQRVRGRELWRSSNSTLDR
jgi:amino acid transporter